MKNRYQRKFGWYIMKAKVVIYREVIVYCREVKCDTEKSIQSEMLLEKMTIYRDWYDVKKLFYYCKCCNKRGLL